MTGLWLVSYIALWVLFLIVAITLVSVLRNEGVLYETLKGLQPALNPPPSKLKPGAVLPELTWHTLQGDAKLVSEFRGAKTAFSIISPTCAPCRDLLMNVAAGDSKAVDPLDPTLRHRVIISLGDIASTAALVHEVALPQTAPVLVDSEGKLQQLWGITATPTTVVVDEQLRVVRHVFGARDQPAPSS